MKKLVLCLVMIPLLLPCRAVAWGPEGHRLVLGRAIELLPDGLRPFYEKHRAFLLEHVSDPDYWHLVGFAEESPRHFVDLDAYGPFPFDDLPRDLGAALRRFGPEALDRHGRLPWRADEVYGRLVRVMQSQGPYAADETAYLSAVLAHYTADAFVPLHAVGNYDGQLTGQQGVHSRFETEAVRRAQPLVLAPASAGVLDDPLRSVFAALLGSYQQADAVLKADRRAAAGHDQYGDAYYAAFVPEVRPILQHRLSGAASLVASMFLTAWEAAGRPDLLARPAHAEKARMR